MSTSLRVTIMPETTNVLMEPYKEVKIENDWLVRFEIDTYNKHPKVMDRISCTSVVTLRMINIGKLLPILDRLVSLETYDVLSDLFSQPIVKEISFINIILQTSQTSTKRTRVSGCSLARNLDQGLDTFTFMPGDAARYERICRHIQTIDSHLIEYVKSVIANVPERKAIPEEFEVRWTKNDGVWYDVEAKTTFKL